MKHEKIAEALNELSDRHIEEAAQGMGKKKSWWAGPIAAVLAVALIVGAVAGSGILTPPETPDQTSPTQATTSNPGTIGHGNKNAMLSSRVATPEYPTMVQFPGETAPSEDWGAWRDSFYAIRNQPDGYADSLNAFFDTFLQAMAADEGENLVCSPVNVYMALAMLAQVTDGESQQQILDLLGSMNMAALRDQAHKVWNAHYVDDGLSTSVLANSLWLDDSLSYKDETAQLLAKEFYASVFHGDLSSEEMAGAIQSWLSEQTGGLLDEQIAQESLDPRTVLALASTIYYQVQWKERFLEQNTSEGLFHGTQGKQLIPFLHDELTYGPYYWSDNFGAVAKHLEDGSTALMILPDEGVTPEALLRSGEVMEFLRQDPDKEEFPNKKTLIVNLALPRFDVANQTKLNDVLQDLGVTDVFTPGKADFTGILAEADDGWVDTVSHAARLMVSEVGVTGAAYTLITYCGAAMPPENEIDFILDRPFIFFVESSDGLPLFVSVINHV